MSLTHAEAQRLMQARADGLLPDDQAMALDEHLHDCEECRRDSARLDGLEMRLKASLQQRYPLEQPDERQVGAVMTRIARNLSGKEPRPSRLHLPAGIAWGAAALLVVALLAWSIRNLLPERIALDGPAASLAASSLAAPSPTTPSLPAPAAAAASPAPENASPALTSTPGETPPLAAASASLFPNTTFTFQAHLPTASETLQLYRQALSEPVTLETARAIAAQLGVSGEVYQSEGEGGETILDVTDGQKSVRFIGTAGVFVYSDSQRLRQASLGSALPPTELEKAAVTFLQEHALLDQTYRAVTPDSQPGRVDLLPELDGHPVIFGIGDQPGGSGWAAVDVSGDTQPSVLYYTRQAYEPVGEYPLLSAEQAWARLSGSAALSYAQYAVLAPEQPSTYRSWRRGIRVGEFQHQYGYAVRLTAAEPGSQDLVSVNDLPLRGDTGGIPMSRMLHLWGVPEIDAGGVVWFALQGWELSPIEETYLSGQIVRQGEQIFVQSEAGRHLLPDAPGELLDGETIEGSGVIVGEAGVGDAGAGTRFEWNHLSSGVYPSSYGVTRACGGSGGGGGGGPENANFGGGSFKGLSLQGGELPAATAPASQFQVGQLVEGWAGTVTIQDFQEASGLRREITFSTQPGFEFEEWHYFYLEGAGLGGIETYQNLPVRVWGQVSGFAQDVPLIAVERFEPLYPGVALQEFAGTQSEVTIDGQPALLLTTQDGAQYVEEQSLGYGEDHRIGRPGDLVEIEGYVVPDLTLGGFAVIRAISGGTPPDGVVYEAQIHTIDMGLGGGVDVASAMSGSVTIDSIELAYAASTLQRCPPMGMDEEFLAKYLTMQPVWVFKGTFEDGRRVEIQVQALPDEYLE